MSGPLTRVEGDLEYALSFHPRLGLAMCPRCHRWKLMLWVWEVRSLGFAHEPFYRRRHLCNDCGKAAERYCRQGAA